MVQTHCATSAILANVQSMVTIVQTAFAKVLIEDAVSNSSITHTMAHAVDLVVSTENKWL